MDNSKDSQQYDVPVDRVTEGAQDVSSLYSPQTKVSIFSGSSIFSIKNICVFLVAFYFVIKTYRYAISTTEAQGGIWNIVQGILVLIGIKIAYSNFIKFRSNKAFLFIWLYSGLTFLYAALEFECNVAYVFGWLTTLYPAAIFTIFYFIGLQGNVVKKDLLDVAFYAMLGICIFSYLRGGEFDGSRVYLSLGLLPLIILRTSDHYRFLPFLVCAMPLFFSGKRGGFLAFVLMTFLFYFNEFKRGKNILQNVRLFVVFLGVTVVLFFSFNFVTTNYTSRLSYKLEKMEEGDTAGRSERWEALITLFMRSSVDKEIFGYGYQAVKKGSGYGALKAHNDYLEILYRYGIIGLSLYLLFIASLFSALFKATRLRYRHAVFIGMELVFSFFLSMASIYMVAIESITAGMVCFGVLLGDYQRFYLSRANYTDYVKISYVNDLKDDSDERDY